MRRHHRKIAASAVVAMLALGALAIGTAVFVRAGVYNIGADDPHYPATYAVLAHLRDASIRRRAADLTVPAGLMSEARLRQGAGNYAAMCAQCHLAPGMAPTELSRGLYPAPPDLTRVRVEVAPAFWTVKHGIKGSGMPAWGGSMADAYIWNMAAFVNRLPSLDAAAYARLVAESGGHSHGGGESDPAPAAAPPAHVDPPGAAPHAHPAAHVDPPGAPQHDHGQAPGTAATASKPHRDAPGAPPHSH